MYKKSIVILALCSAALLFLSTCKDNVSPDIEDSLELFAGLELIPEASETVVTINKGTDEANDGFFTISVGNIQSNTLLTPGTHEAWCLEWKKNLRSSGDVHRDVKWYSSGSNEKWKPLNYFFSIRDELKNDDPELTFREIQAIVWVLAGEMGIAPEFDVMNLPVDQLPSRLRSNGEADLSRDRVAGIARMVMQNAPGATIPLSGMIAQTADDEQDIFVPPTEPDNDAFITTWDTSLLLGTSVTLALAGEVDATIDWGDGTITEVNAPGPHIHDYGTDGIYTVSVTGSVTAYNSFSNSSPNEPRKLLTVESWGDLGFEDLSFAFHGARNLTSVPNTSKGIEGVTNMSNMFQNATSFNYPIGDWDTGAVTDMSWMFYRAMSFNQPIGGWDTGSVINMGLMFGLAASFNQPIGDWNTGAVTNMGGMFAVAKSFNQPIGDWNTAAVTNMNDMFESATSFNQPIGDWNTAAVTNMGGMFSRATSFNQPIGDWNTEAVTNMGAMFSEATSFNQSIGSWNTATVSTMGAMFYRASSFNQPIGDWNTGTVIKMNRMFENATSFNQPIGSWNTSAVTDMNLMFRDADSFNQPIGDWNTAAVTDMSFMFYFASAFNQDLSEWCVELIFSEPNNFDNGADAWTLPDSRPVWGTCPL